MTFLKQHRTKITIISTGLLCLALGYFIGGNSPSKHHPHRQQWEEERSYNEKLQFISPLLECNGGQTVELKSFKSDIEKLANTLKAKSEITDLSVYFREMNNGLWFGINENIEFSPASLLKFPLMIAYLKEAEKNPKILDDTLTYTENENLYDKQNFKPEITLEVGTQYTVKDLVGRMIVHSDNSAQALLMKNATYFWQRPFAELEINPPGTESVEDYMSVVEYARFFRVLYNASYINPQYSNLALGILSESKFKEGLAKGVPSDIAVAHKFGERTIDNVKQLHDCGIVYHPDNPYLLCIMTRGKDFNQLTNAIQQISQKIYTGVDSQKIKK